MTALYIDTERKCCSHVKKVITNMVRKAHNILPKFWQNVDALQMYITVSVKLVDLYLQKETNTRKRPPRNCNPMQQNLNY